MIVDDVGSNRCLFQMFLPKGGGDPLVSKPGFTNEHATTSETRLHENANTSETRLRGNLESATTSESRFRPNAMPGQIVNVSPAPHGWSFGAFGSQPSPTPCLRAVVIVTQLAYIHNEQNMYWKQS